MSSETGSIEECVYNRTYSIEEVLREPNLHGVLKLCGFSVFTLGAVVLVFSVVQAFARKYVQLGQNSYRMWFIRMFAGRFVPYDSNDYQEQSCDLDEKAIKRNIIASKNTYSWFFKLANYSDEDIRRIAGSDGLRYLRFTRKIVFILLAYSFCSPIVIGLHTLGGLGKGLPSLWAATTLANVEANDGQVEIVHSFLGMLTLSVALGAFVVYMYNNQLFGNNTLDETNPPALFVRGIDERDCSPAAVERYLQDNAGRKLQVKSVRLFKRNEAELERLGEELSIVIETIERLEALPEEEYVRRSRFSDEKTEAVTYYLTKKKEIEHEIHETSLDSEYTGSAIVYFESEDDTREALKGMGRFTQLAAVLPKIISYTEYALRNVINSRDNPKRWLVSFAPPNEDIDLENLVTHNPMQTRVVKVFVRLLIPVVMMLGAFVPEPVISALHGHKLFDGFLAESVLFPGAKFLWNTGVLLLVKYLATHSRAHCPLKSKKHEAIMHYILYYLALGDILMPLFNLANITDFFVWFADLYHGRDPAWARVECLFRENIGVRLANSIIVSAFMRDIMLMLRLTHFTDIPPCKSSTRTEAEVRHRHKSVTSEVGYRYADFLYLYCMGVSVALTQPMVPWCAVICMFFRYWVDKHSLCHTYAKSLHTDKLHRHAIPLAFQPFILQSGTQLLFNSMRDAKFNKGATSLSTTISLVYFVYVVIVNVVCLTLEQLIKLRRYRVKKRCEEREIHS